MSDDFSNALSALRRRHRAMWESIGPVPNRAEAYLTMLHGSGWKERALAAGRPEAGLGYATKLRELEQRIRRIERHLKLEPSGAS